MERKKINIFIRSNIRIYWRRQLLAIIFVGALVVLHIVFPYLTKVLLDEVIPAKDISRLLNFILIMFSVWLGSLIVGYVGEIIYGNTSLKVKSDIRKRMMKKMYKLPITFFYKNKPGEIVAQLISDLELVGSVIAEMLPIMVLGITQLVFTFLIMFLFSWKLALVPTVVFLFSFLFIAILNGFVEKRSRNEREAFGKLSGVVTNILENMKIIKIIYPINWLTNYFNRFQIEHIKQNKKLIRTLKLLGSLQNATGGLITFTTLAYGGYLVMRGEITIGVLIAFWAYVQSVFQPLQLFMQANMLIRESYGSLTRTIELLDSDEEIQSNSSSKKSFNSIRFNQISFGYEDKEVIRDFNLELNAAEITTLVGESGVGKSTILNILLGTLEPKNGFITVNDERIKHLTSIRKHVGYVEQSPTLFENCSIKENVLLGRKVNEKQFKEIMIKTNLDQIVKRFKKGIETLVSEVQFSGGEKQIIAFARALINDPQLIILDEVTANIDSKTERLIQDCLKTLRNEGKIILMVAHRLSSVLLSDKIVMLDEGIAIAEGTHKELFDDCEAYKNLYSLQVISDE